MTRPIRAFLTWKDGSDWSVSVCRDLEGVLEAWNAASAAGQSAVLHIGFDRPPSAAFEEVVLAHPRRLLVTASAKHGLPAGYEAAADAVGHVNGIPIHVGTRGWGYWIDDLPLVGAQRVQEAAVPEFGAAQPSEGWVANLLAMRPDLLGAFQTAGIVDDASYLSVEQHLPWDARLRAGQFRFHDLLDEALEDPCAMARAAPPWLSQRAFGTLSLPTRPANIFINLGIERVSDLGRWSMSELLRTPNLGRTSLKEVCDVLTKALDEGPFDVGAKIALAGVENLRLEIQRTLASLDAREQDILSRRMGFGRPAETLQSIAEDYGVTRERVRQIEAKVVKRTIREAYWDDLLTGKLEALLTGRDFPLPLLGIEALDPWFSGISEHPEAIRYILANFCGDHIGIVNIDGIDYFGFIHQTDWDTALAEAHRTLAFSAGKGWTEDQCQALVAPLVKERSREFQSILWEKASARCHFTEGQTGERTLVSYGRGAEHLVEAILADAGRPLHYSEIAKLAAEQGRAIDIRRIHNAAAAVGVLVGRGTFASAGTLGFSDEESDRIVDAAEDAVTSGPASRQWHASEILAALVEGDAAPPGLDKYSLDFLLRKSGRLRRLGRMAWAQAIDTAPAERIEVREAVVALLEEAGRPLSTNDIRQRLIAVRGVNRVFQLHPADPLIRLDTSLWGLNDRDVPLKRPEQMELTSKIVRQLTADGRGIHISEMRDVLAGFPTSLTASAAFALAALDQRIGVSVGQYLYLKEWSGPRRETIAEAVRAALGDSEQALSIDEIERRVSDRLGRPADRGKLSATLQDPDYEFDPQARRWSISETGDDEIPEEELAAE